MIKVENIDVWGFEHAIRGMRNPMNSWDKSDSKLCVDTMREACVYEDAECRHIEVDELVIGHNDAALMERLFKAGTEHRKYLRQIMVSMDITAPLYWWKEFDTYKVGTTANSCSTMHKIHAKEFTLNDFSHEHLFPASMKALECLIIDLNDNREQFIRTNHKDYWWQIIQLLPSSYNQKRTITMNYENVMNIIHQRSNHKLDEWVDFVEILYHLPYVGLIRGCNS